MPVHDFTSERLFVEAPLAAGARIACSPEQANYLANVLRLGGGRRILLVFNGRDGEWRARLADAGKRVVRARGGGAGARADRAGPTSTICSRRSKRARLDYMVQKATEMGVARLAPVLTRHTVAERVNLERMRANAIEAAEQCGILRVPEVAEPEKLAPCSRRGTPRARSSSATRARSRRRSSSSAGLLGRTEPGRLPC